MVNINFTLGMEPLGLTQYLLNPDKQKDSAQAIISTNMGGRDAYELAEEFRFMHDLRPNVKYSVRHFSLSFAPNEQVGDDQFRATVRRLLELTGHQKCSYFAVRHHDQEHKNGVEHGHVAVSAIGYDGRRVSDSNILRRLKQKDLSLGQSIERQLEADLGLVPGTVRPEAERRNVSTGEYRFKQRTEAMLPKEKLWDAIDFAAGDKPTMPVLVTRLKAAGVEVQFHDTDHKRKHKGLSFAINGSKFQGGKLGKSYSLGGLKEHRQVSYEPERDDERLRELNGLSAEECRSRLVDAQPQQAAPELPEIQIDQTALAQHLGALVREIWQREKAGSPNLRAASFEEYSIQAEDEELPKLFKEGELILEATENGYQRHGLTEADGEAVEQQHRLSNQMHHERELQRQTHEWELEREAERQKQAEDLRTRQAESILNFVEGRLDNLERKNKGHSLKTSGGAYSITRDHTSQLITITGKEGQVILEAKRTGAAWHVSTNNVQPEDVEAFTRYQEAREDKKNQPQVLAEVELQPPAPGSHQWTAAQLILKYVQQRLDATGRDEMKSKDERYFIKRDPNQGGIVVYDQEHGEPIAIGGVDNGEWQIIHADVGDQDAENFIAYQQAQQDKGAKVAKTRQKQDAGIGGIGD